MANFRREFFRVTLDEIRDAVRKNFGEVTFVTIPQAEEYRQSSAIHEDSEKGGSTLSSVPPA